MVQTYIKLNDGTKIPQFGIGVYQVPEGEATINTVKTALKMGIRHIDTAHAYQNERSVGKAMKKAVLLEVKFGLQQNFGPVNTVRVKPQMP